MCFNFFKKKPTPQPTPFDLGPILQEDGWWIDDLLIGNIPEMARGVERLPLDGKYWIPGLEDCLKIIEWDFIDRKQYLIDRFDCDDFAAAFFAQVRTSYFVNNVALVIDWSSGHAYNLIFTSEGKLILFEPQSDKYWDINDHNFADPYALKRAQIII